MTSPAEYQSEIDRLKTENSRLISLLESHRIPWKTDQDENSSRKEPAYRFSSTLTTDDKMSLFQNLFRGRKDVYPVRWESGKGTSGYAPACANEWRHGFCQKPHVKCSNCNNRDLSPVTHQTIYDHLAGRHTIGVYPLLIDDTCYFLAVDFDEEEWHDDVQAFQESCRESSIPCSIEISRSCRGAHAWIFFSEAVSARNARRLGAALISMTCARTRQLTLSSYDHFFPNQDTLPKGGFGNLIALPLQKKPRENGFSVFVDDHFQPHPDQWAFLLSVEKLSASEVESAMFHISGQSHPLDVAFVTGEDEDEPWKRPRRDDRITGTLPESITLVLANQIFIVKDELPQQLTNRLIRLTAFQNPEFYRTQAMRLSVWNKPRIIGCAENYPKHISLPRGCLDDVLALFAKHNIACQLQDERNHGNPITADFKGNLRQDQENAVTEILKHDVGVLCAPTAFGKTVTTAALIARRCVNTLIIVHRTELLNQWKERLRTFLNVAENEIGVIGAGKNKPSEIIDVAVMQSLSRKENQAEILDKYGQIIVDECHHLSAFSFESILKQCRARYVIGLTATPIRRDGHHPIIFMQCGPIRHTASRPDTAPSVLTVVPRWLPMPEISTDNSIQALFQQLTQNEYRNSVIIEDVRAAYQEGRKIIVLTERTDHLELLKEKLGSTENVFVLHGRLSKKTRTETFARLCELGDSVPRILLATGKLIGEGFDYPPLDTLVLAMPISWKGILQQYAGRLHLEHATKRDVRIYDYAELGHALLRKMWEKRVRGYLAMGYEIDGTLDGGVNLW